MTCGGRVTRPVSGGGPQAPYRRGLGGQGSLSRLSVSYQPRAARGAAPAQGPGRRLLGPPMYGCTLMKTHQVRKLLPEEDGHPASLLGPLREVVRPTLDTRGADVLEPSPALRRQVVGADTKPWPAHPGGSPAALLRSQEPEHVKAIVTDGDLPKETRSRKVSPVTVTALGGGTWSSGSPSGACRHTPATALRSLPSP